MLIAIWIIWLIRIYRWRLWWASGRRMYFRDSSSTWISFAHNDCVLLERVLTSFLGRLPSGLSYQYIEVIAKPVFNPISSRLIIVVLYLCSAAFTALAACGIGKTVLLISPNDVNTKKGALSFNIAGAIFASGNQLFTLCSLSFGWGIIVIGVVAVVFSQACLHFRH